MKKDFTKYLTIDYDSLTKKELEIIFSFFVKYFRKVAPIPVEFATKFDELSGFLEDNKINLKNFKSTIIENFNEKEEDILIDFKEFVPTKKDLKVDLTTEYFEPNTSDVQMIFESLFRKTPINWNKFIPLAKKKLDFNLQKDWFDLTLSVVGASIFEYEKKLFLKVEIPLKINEQNFVEIDYSKIRDTPFGLYLQSKINKSELENIIFSG